MMIQIRATCGVVFLVGVLSVLSSPTWAGTAVVDTLNDVLDGDVTSLTSLAATPGADGEISLREAIQASNNSFGEDTITFSVPGTISVLSALPTLSDTTGGTTITGAAQIVLDNGSGLQTVDGLTVTTQGNEIQGLTIQGFAKGIYLTGSSAKTNFVIGCHVGGQRTGEGVLINPNSIGVVIGEGARENIIGAAAADSGNTLSNNALHGLMIDSGAAANMILRNRIGTTADGLSAAPNELSGLVINNAHGNVIGSAIDDEGNVISGNAENGVMILNTSSLNLIRNNIIGLNANSDAALPNTTGILIGSSSINNTIGDTVSGNGNNIGGNTGDGISIQNAGFNQIFSNVIGGFFDDAYNVGNGGNGISVSGISEGNFIGDETFATANEINYNGGDGVRLDGSATRKNLVSQNEIFGNGGMPIRIINGAQEGISPPTILPLDPGGIVFGSTVSFGTVELFELADGALFFLERVVADAKGGFQSASPITRIERSTLVATVTDSNQNTSEFSLPQVIPVTLNANPIQLVDLFLQSDLNRDERLSLAEFQAATGRGSTTFDAADVDGDGLLTYEELFAASLAEAAFTSLQVNTLGDVSDAPNTSSVASLLLDPGADGKISLREALLATQFDSSVYITFSEAGTIQPGSELPAISDISSRIYIDGKGGVVLDGSLLSSDESGLIFTGIGSQVLGLQIVNFPGAGIKLAGGGSFSNHVFDCRIGTDGNGAQGNGIGILITEASENNAIGGGLSALGNLISGNTVGIRVEGVETSFNTISGNLIGVNVAGTSAIPNVKNGIELANGSSFNFVIAFGAYAVPNVISGNGDGSAGGGISITDGSNRNFILGNVIGSGDGGTPALGNNPHGIAISGGSNTNFIGLDEDSSALEKSLSLLADAKTDGPRKGLVPEDFLSPNLIADNVSDGVSIGGETTIKNTMFYNSIFNNGGEAIKLSDGANGGIAPPEITTARTRLVTGKGVPSGLVQVFSDEADESQFTVDLAQCDSEGNWSIEVDKSTKGLRFYTAANTDSLGNTSALSEPVEISDTPECTDPDADSDGDGVTDCDEAIEGTDPELPDTDGDGMPDGFEIEFTLNPLSVDDAALDNDHDFLSNLEEYLGGTDPNVADNVDITLHVDSEIGVDGPDNGAVDNPLRTIGAAMTRARRCAGNGEVCSPGRRRIRRRRRPGGGRDPERPGGRSGGGRRHSGHNWRHYGRGRRGGGRRDHPFAGRHRNAGQHGQQRYDRAPGAVHRPRYQPRGYRCAGPGLGFGQRDGG